MLRARGDTALSFCEARESWSAGVKVESTGTRVHLEMMMPFLVCCKVPQSQSADSEDVRRPYKKVL